MLLDPGHGGLDPGAKAENGMAEAELNLDVAQRVRGRLLATAIALRLVPERRHT